MFKKRRVQQLIHNSLYFLTLLTNSSGREELLSFSDPGESE
jgi:hypothetical protein